MSGRQGEPMMGTDPSTWKWTQVASYGKFAGHSAGPFELNATVMDEMVRNYRDAGLPIVFDLEHASEADATSGTIPVNGAPAQGWIHDLQHRPGVGLFALVEWSEQAKDYIKSGKYAFCSPAVRFGTKDRVTGRPIGARLSSVAMTNQPFLTSLDKLAAKDTGHSTAPTADVVALKNKGLSPLSAPVMSAHSYMPQLRAALKLGELSTPDDCADAMDKLRDMCMSVGPSGTHSGVNMGDYTSALGDLVGAGPGTTWDDVFDIIDSMIEDAMAQHEFEYHGGQSAGMTDNGGAAVNTNQEETTTMADEAHTIALKDAQTKAVELTTKLTASEGAVVTLTAKVKETETLLAQASTQLKDATAKLTETEAKAKAVEAEVVTLRDERAKRDAADLERDVEVAFATYKDKRALKDADKAHMLSHAKADTKGFHAMYPPVGPGQEYLLRDLVKPEPRPEGDKAAVTVSGVRRRLMSEKKMSYMDAEQLANDVIAGRSEDPFKAGK